MSDYFKRGIAKCIADEQQLYCGSMAASRLSLDLSEYSFVH